MIASAALVGREDELRDLDRALDAVDRGEPRLVGVFGEPGIGKSRLLGELAVRASARGHLVLAGRAAELEHDVPFALWAETIDEYVGSAALAGMPESEVAELAVALPAAGAVPRSVERHRLARAIRLLLTRLGGSRPVTLLLDDVQWADPASADVLTLLAHRPPERTLVAMAARTQQPPTLGAALDTAARHGLAQVLELAPLPPAAAETLLPAGMGPAARARVLLESGGNPFYLEALTRASASSAAAPAPRGVPRAVMCALAGEIAALAPLTRLLAQGAAVAGDPFEPSLAAAAADLRESAALAALDALVAADVVRPGDQPRRFRFRHPLVRHAVYEATGSGWRLAAHARAADALAARGATTAARAHHVERAARPGDLAAAELLASAAAETAAAVPGTAAVWYESALRLLPETAEYEEQRAALLAALGSALVSAGRAVEARSVLRGLLGRLPAGAAERIAVAERLAQIEALWTHDLEAAHRLLEAEREALGEVAPRLAAALTVARATTAFAHADHAATGALAEQARAEARAAGDRTLEAVAAVLAADAAHCRLRRDDQDALAAVDTRIAEAGARVDALSDDQVAEHLHGLAGLSTVRHFTGDLAGALAATERGLTLARRTGQGLLAPAFVSMRAHVECELGRLDSAQADGQEALESALLSGHVRAEYCAAIALSRIALARGLVDLAIEHAQAAWDRLGRNEPYAQAGYVLADARLAAGDTQSAAAAMEACGWLGPRMRTLDRVRAVEVAVRVRLAEGRLDDAAAWAGRAAAEGGGRRSGVVGAIGAHAEATVLLARGDERRAAAVALTAAAEAERVGASLWAGRCRTLAGQALGARGRDELRRAAAEFEQLGAWGYRDAALRALRRLGERPRTTTGAPAGEGPLAALTPREREVAGLVADGQTNAQIAFRLHLSQSTVEKHVSRTLGKLGLSTRAGLIGLRPAHP